MRPAGDRVEGSWFCAAEPGGAPTSAAAGTDLRIGRACLVSGAGRPGHRGERGGARRQLGNAISKPAFHHGDDDSGVARRAEPVRRF